MDIWKGGHKIMITTILGLSVGLFLIILGIIFLFFINIIRWVLRLPDLIFFSLGLSIPSYNFRTNFIAPINNFIWNYKLIIGIALIGIGIYLGGLGVKFW